MQIKSKPSVGPASLRQTERKITLCSSAKTGEAHSCSTWQKASCRKNTAKDTSLRGWQRATFLHNAVIFKKGCDGNPLRCLGPEEAKEMIKEVHSGECGEHQRKKRLYRCLLQMGYYWPAMKKDTAETYEKVNQQALQQKINALRETLKLQECSAEKLSDKGTHNRNKRWKSTMKSKHLSSNAFNGRPQELERHSQA